MCDHSWETDEATESQIRYIKWIMEPKKNYILRIDLDNLSKGEASDLIQALIYDTDEKLIAEKILEFKPKPLTKEEFVKKNKDDKNKQLSGEKGKVQEGVDDFWEYHLKEIRKMPNDYFILNDNLYFINSNSSADKGYNGKIFKIITLGGRERVSNNVCHLGKLPVKVKMEIESLYRKPAENK